MIRELIGKDREREEEAFVYGEDGEKNEIMAIKEEFAASWKENIYQKAEKVDFSFWYGENGIKTNVTGRKRRRFRDYEITNDRRKRIGYNNK